MNKAWQFFDGWKTLIGAVAYLGVLVWDSYHNGHAASFVSSILIVLGIDVSTLGQVTGVEFGKLAAALVVVIGGVHKVWKAQAQLRAGAAPTQLLSSEGYTRERSAQILANSRRRR